MTMIYDDYINNKGNVACLMDVRLNGASLRCKNMNAQSKLTFKKVTGPLNIGQGQIAMTTLERFMMIGSSH